MSKHLAAPGYLLVEPLKEKSEVTIIGEQKGRIGLGRVLAVGADAITDFGSKVPCPCKVGDIIYFLQYEGEYDTVFIQGKKYIFALFKDVRGYEK
jgi:co-chaperonin GroES (HSP10)